MNGWHGYAINVTSRTCDLNCAYCYGRRLCFKSAQQWGNAKVRKIFLNRDPEDLIAQVRRELLFLPRKSNFMLSSFCDPFQRLERNVHLMEPILTGLQHLPVQTQVMILTKSADARKYFPYIKAIPNIKFGMTISCTDESVRTRLEPNASPYPQRLETLRHFVTYGIYTWASCEPIFPYISPIPLIYELQDLGVRWIVFGKLNYYGNRFNPWYKQIREEIVKTCEEIKMSYFIKEELRKL